MTKPLTVEHHDDVVTILLNRPERKNALSLSLLRALNEALSNAQQTHSTALILAGVGNCFSAGADLNELTGTIDDLEVDDAIEAVVGKIRELPVPVIAAIDGPCLGGAFDLAISCDVRIASRNAFFQLPATRLSLLYNPRAIQRMHRLLGRDTVFRLLVTGERFDAETALRIGIVSCIGEELESHATALAYSRQAASNSRSAVADTKKLLNALDAGTYDTDFWEQQRRLHLSSSERHAAVTKVKARISGK
ncbi:MAG: enoyl-CoA hydratase/isomerase family protein [Gammaproteobacteria bacterium]|nr:enoyl-CoA hydratase/isomerase family protein [Gammaproteobacteria bacterium]